MPETKTPEEVRRRHQELSVNEEQTKQALAELGGEF